MSVLKDIDINREVIDNMLSIASEVIGDNAVKLITNNIVLEDSQSGRLIVYKIAEEIENIYGSNGGAAIFRQLGREIAKRLMDNHNQHEWKSVMEIGLNTMGFAEGIQSSSEGACICNCVFYTSFLEPNGIKPIQHPICWGGLGFIEAFAKRLEPDVVEVRWKYRDYENKRCTFEYIRGENGKG